jgi:hypothetical protein
MDSLVLPYSTCGGYKNVGDVQVTYINNHDNLHNDDCVVSSVCFPFLINPNTFVVPVRTMVCDERNQHGRGARGET